MQNKRLEAENDPIRQQLSASFTLAGYLLEATSEGAVILSAMKVSTDLLGADGSAFVPFNEWKQSMGPLEYGEAEFLQNKDWQKRLSAPATRHACRVCELKQAGTECPLLQGPVGASNIICVSLQSGGRDVGNISYFFSAPPEISDEQHQFLVELVRLTALALDGLQVRAQEVEANRLARIPADFKQKLQTLDAKTEELLEQLEYKAVLDERTRLAREIHDGLAQTLALLKLETARMQGYASKGDVESVSRVLQACNKTLADAYLDARQAIDNLRHVPDELFADWLESHAAEFSEMAGIEVDATNIHLHYVFSPGEKAQLVRIVQEALTNVRKHAQASSVMLSAVERDQLVILEICDNGCGFAPEETHPASQYGLRSMRERAEAIGADFQIISAPGAGTTVRLLIPGKEKAGL